MQTGNVDAVTGIGREASPRCCRAKGRIEKRASTGTDADTHLRTDPQLAKASGGEQRAHVSPVSDAMFGPCMPVGEQAA